MSPPSVAPSPEPRPATHHRHPRDRSPQWSRLGGRPASGAPPVIGPCRSGPAHEGASAAEFYSSGIHELSYDNAVCQVFVWISARIDLPESAFRPGRAGAPRRPRSLLGPVPTPGAPANRHTGRSRRSIQRGVRRVSPDRYRRGHPVHRLTTASITAQRSIRSCHPGGGLGYHEVQREHERGGARDGRGVGCAAAGDRRGR